MSFEAGCPSISTKALSSRTSPQRCVSTACHPERLRTRDSVRFNISLMTGGFLMMRRSGSLAAHFARIRLCWLTLRSSYAISRIQAVVLYLMEITSSTAPSAHTSP